LSDAARQIGVKEETLSAWEDEHQEKYPTLTQLYVLAEKYGQPAGVFYLTESPLDEPLPHDFRFLPESADQGINPALIKEIRRAQRIRDEAFELSEDLGVRQPRCLST
jgi:transcriptional regulator with XRE-family HTH domain